MSVTKRRIALVLALTAWIVSTAAHMTAQQGPPAPSAAAVADSEAVAATHRSRTLAALFEEFRTTTPDNARINSRAISNLFSDGNPLMRLVSSGDFSPIQPSANPITRFEADAIASFKAGGPDMDPDVCQKCHSSFPADNTALVGSLNHCDVVR